MAGITKQFTTNESISRTQTLTVTLPKLKEVLNVTVNTGTATYENVVGNEEQIRLTLTGGVTTRTVDNSYWVSAHTKTETRPASRGREIHVWEVYSGGRWKYDESREIGASLSIPFDDGTYKGDLHFTETSRNRVDNAYPSNPKEGDVWRIYILYLRGHYEGSVTRPGYTVYDYTNYYQYIITVKYKETGFEWLIRVNNALRTASVGWVKVDEQLREIDTAHIKINGELKEV